MRCELCGRRSSSLVRFMGRLICIDCFEKVGDIDDFAGPEATWWEAFTKKELR